MVEKVLRKLDGNKSFGPDEMHPKMLKELFDYIAEPLALFMNETLLTGAWRMEISTCNSDIQEQRSAKLGGELQTSEFDFNRLQADGIDSKRTYYATSC